MRFLIASLVLLFCTNLALAQESCFTANGESGTCVPALSCKYVTDLRATYGQFLPVSIQRKLMASACSTQGRSLRLCCANESANTPRAVPQTGQRNSFQTQRRTSVQKPNPFLSSQDSKRIDLRGLSVLQAETTCGIKPVIKVSDGEVTRIGEFPWLALLKYNTEGRQFLCGGSLITNRYVLTAAHCVSKREPIGVRLGEHDLSTDKDCQYSGKRLDCLPPHEDYGIAAIKPHLGYTSTPLKNDIALIKLDRPVEFKLHIKPICLPINEAARNVAYDQSYYIAGWGRTERRDEDASSVLLKAFVERKELEVCQRYFQAPLSENHLCAAGNNRVHTCAGDSGGPVFFLNGFEQTLRYIQYAVVSFGGSSCGRNIAQPGVFTNVMDLLPWITQNID